MPNYERDGATIYYEEHGSGFPLLLLAPGGLNSAIPFWERMRSTRSSDSREDFRSSRWSSATPGARAGRSTRVTRGGCTPQISSGCWIISESTKR